MLPWREKKGNEAEQLEECEAPNTCSRLFIRISSEIEPIIETSSFWMQAVGHLPL